MPQYQLNYFNVRGLAELSRLIFAEAGQEFTDHRFGMEEWTEEKKNKKRYPFGVAPTLEVDGQVVPESLPMARYLASEFGLNGKDNLEKARCDTIVDFLKETRVELKPVMPIYLKETDEAKIAQMKKEIFEGKAGDKLVVIEGILKSNNDGAGFFVGDGVTWADLSLADIGFTMISMYPTALDKTPLLKALYERVMARPAIKKHCDSRPPTIM